jgi:hypothetical protein
MRRNLWIAALAGLWMALVPGSARASSQTDCNAFLLANPLLHPASATCSQTELALFVKHSTCLACLMNADCVDTTTNTAAECDDFASTTLTPECVNTLECELGVSSINPPALVNPPTSLQVAYCGTGPVPCTPPNGVCLSQIVAGFPAGFTQNQIEMNISNPIYASGRAGSILTCGLSNNCTACSAQLTMSVPAVSPGTPTFALLVLAMLGVGTWGAARRGSRARVLRAST